VLSHLSRDETAAKMGHPDSMADLETGDRLFSFVTDCLVWRGGFGNSNTVSAANNHDAEVMLREHSGKAAFPRA